MKLDMKPPKLSTFLKEACCKRNCCKRNCLKKIFCTNYYKLLRKETYKENLKRFALFFVRTIDFIADPNHLKPKEEGGIKIPLELFSVGQMLSSKIKHSESDEFTYILRYVKGLKMTKKYDIALSNSNNHLNEEVGKFKEE